MSIINPVRGTKDLFSNNMLLFNHVVDVAKHMAYNYNFSQIETPIFEYADVFHRHLGDTSDIITKETYTFSDRDKRLITLRPEYTAAIARAVFSNNLHQSLPQRLFSYGPIFRHERPQKCRQRQFHQLNYEMIGCNTFMDDVELIKLALDLLKNIGIAKNITLELNSLGCTNSRKAYQAALVEYFSQYKSDLTEDSLMRLQKNPLRILDSKDENEQKIIATAPNIEDHFTAESHHFWDHLRATLQHLKIDYKVNNKLVRGLDYYTHTVFEITTDLLGSQNTILAGGRYDALYSQIGNKDIPAVGFASGIERIMEILSINKFATAESHSVAIIPMGTQAQIKSYQISDILRTHNIRCYIDFEGKIAKRLKKATMYNNADIAIIFGDDELQKNSVNIKNLLQSTEETTKIEDIIHKIKQIRHSL